MKCGKGHDHADIAEVKACYGLPADLEVRQANLVPTGPRSPRPDAQRTAQRIAAQEANTALYRLGNAHGFTPACPQCVAGTHSQKVVSTDGKNVREMQSDEPEQDRWKRDEARAARGYGRTPNRYAGNCTECAGRVEVQAGLLTGNREGGYGVVHRDGECLPMPDIMEAANTMIPAKKKFDPLPDVPEGHYAIQSLTGNNDLDFFRVDRPTEGDWKGKTYVKRVIGGHPDSNIRFTQYRTVLQAILDAGPEKAGFAYADAIGRCYKCNRHLTDDDSRARGMGPDCASK